MKSLTFNKSSWHYTMAHAAGFEPGNDNQGDICEYTKAVLKCSLAALFCAAVFAGVSFLLVHLILGIAFSLWYGVWMMTVWGEATIMVLVIGTFVVTLFFGVEWLIKWNRNRKYNKEDKPDGFIKHAYRSWKEKYCVQVTFKD